MLCGELEPHFNVDSDQRAVRVKNINFMDMEMDICQVIHTDGLLVCKRH